MLLYCVIFYVESNELVQYIYEMDCVKEDLIKTGNSETVVD